RQGAQYALLQAAARPQARGQASDLAQAGALAVLAHRAQFLRELLQLLAGLAARATERGAERRVEVQHALLELVEARREVPGEIVDLGLDAARLVGAEPLRELLDRFVEVGQIPAELRQQP